MANLLLLIAEVWLLGLLVLLLHALSPRIGFAPLLMFVGGLTVLTQSQLGVFIEPYPNLVLFITSNIFVPIILLATLVVYVVNGSIQARILIYGILFVSLLTLFIQIGYQLHLSLPQSGTISGLPNDVISPPLNPRITLASIMTFALDMVVIAVFYQGLRNYIPRLPDTAAIGLALLVALWTDAILFRILSDLGTSDFIALLPGDTLGKTFSAILLWPWAAIYLAFLAPRYPRYQGRSKRRTLDLLFGTFNELKGVLDRTQAALRQSEALRREEESYFRQIAENINEALWLAVAANPILFLSTRLMNAFGGRAQKRFMLVLPLSSMPFIPTTASVSSTLYLSKKQESTILNIGWCGRMVRCVGCATALSPFEIATARFTVSRASPKILRSANRRKNNN